MVIDSVFEKNTLLSFLFTLTIPTFQYFFSSKILSLLFPYFFGEGHLKACRIGDVGPTNFVQIRLFA